MQLRYRSCLLQAGRCNQACNVCVASICMTGLLLAAICVITSTQNATYHVSSLPTCLQEDEVSTVHYLTHASKICKIMYMSVVCSEHCFIRTTGVFMQEISALSRLTSLRRLTLLQEALEVDTMYTTQSIGAGHVICATWRLRLACRSF